jgi:hypothetical protein
MSHFAHFLNPAPVGTVRVLLYTSCDVLLLYAIRDRCDVSQAIVGCRIPNLKWVTKLEFLYLSSLVEVVLPTRSIVSQAYCADSSEKVIVDHHTRHYSTLVAGRKESSKPPIDSRPS